MNKDSKTKQFNWWEITDVKVIPNSQIDRKDFESSVVHTNSTEIALAPEHLESLKQGKCIASYDGETTIFITMMAEHNKC